MAKLEKADYLEEWKHLSRIEANSYKYYNKTILVLSSGAFVLSLLSLDHMRFPHYLFFIIYAWLFWVITMLLQLASFSMYPKSIHQEKLQLEALYKDLEKKPTFTTHYTMMQRLSLLSTLGFGMGIFFFIVFILYNLNCF